jgi:putative pyruvate formate lyase activating enzyme
VKKVKVLLDADGNFHFDDVDEALYSRLKEKGVPFHEPDRPEMGRWKRKSLQRRIEDPRWWRTYLEETIRWLKEEYRKCRLCHLRCGNDRFREETPCRASLEGAFFDLFVHPGMETGLDRVLHVMLTGCSLDCFFCSKDQERGREKRLGLVSREDVLAGLQGGDFEWAAFSGGNPDENVLAVLGLLADLERFDRPIIWETHGCIAPELLSRLAPIVDLFIPSVKYGNDACAERGCGVRRYTGWVEDAIVTLQDAGADLLLRHSRIPGHATCCEREMLALAARRGIGRWSEVDVFPGLNLRHSLRWDKAAISRPI